MSDITRILTAINQGETGALDKLLPLVYGELRNLAAHKMANLAAGHTLQPTALVHEAWLRLIGLEEPKFDCRRHFFAAAAEAMRHILIDDARKKASQRRGSGQRPITLDEVEIALPTCGDRLLALDEALEKFTMERPLEAEVVKLRFFVGLTIDEAAEVLGISPRTAQNYWAYARTWLYDKINSDY